MTTRLDACAAFFVIHVIKSLRKSAILWGGPRGLSNTCRRCTLPLKPGRANIGHNIKELAINSKTGERRPMKQRIAIALDEARRTGADIPKRKARLHKLFGR